MPTRAELKELAHMRLKEATALHERGYYDGAYYLAGYTAELALKARICKVLDVEKYPDAGAISSSFKTHRLQDLLRLAGLERKLDKAKTDNRDLLENWSLVAQWSEEYRYRPVGTNPQADIEVMLNALTDPINGVFTWIRKYW